MVPSVLLLLLLQLAEVVAGAAGIGDVGGDMLPNMEAADGFVVWTTAPSGVGTSPGKG
jgi:hypothetical protein